MQCRNNAHLHSWSPRYTPPTMGVWKEIQEPFFLPLCSLRDSVAGIFPVTFSNTYFSSRSFRHQLSTLLSFKIMMVSPYWDSISPWKSSTKWMAMIKDAVQLSGVDRVGSGSSRPACLAGIWVTYHPDMCCLAPSNTSRRKSLHR